MKLITLLEDFSRILDVKCAFGYWISLLLILLGMLFSAPSLATTEALLITIGYLPDDRTNTGDTVSIDREQIDASQASSVADVLRQVPGLHVEQPGGSGSVSSVYIRGADPNFTVVLIDGVKVNDPTNSRGGSFDFSTLSLDEIESIEISRSSLSAIYGSDAISGVISISTRPAGTVKRLSVNIGSDNYYQLAARSSHHSDDLDYGIAVNVNDDGHAITGQRSRRQSGNVYLRKAFAKYHYVDLQLRHAESEHRAFPDDSGGQRFAVIRDTDDRDVRSNTLGFTYQYKPDDAWNFFLGYDYFEQLEKVESPGVAPGIRDPFGVPVNNFDNDFNRERLLAYVSSRPLNEIKLVLGAEITHEDGDSAGGVDFGFFQLNTDFDLQRDNKAVFAEMRYAISPVLNVMASYRIDNPDDFSDSSNASLGMDYRIKNTVIFLKFSEGFKLPSFFALSHPLVGNADLKPETSDNIEAGIRYQSDRYDAQLTIYKNVIDNLVDLQETPVLQLVNRDEVVLQGVEADIGWRLMDDIDMNVHASYVDTDIRNSNERLRGRPRWHAGATLNWRHTRKLSTVYIVEHVGTVFDSSIPTGDVNLDAYTRFDANLRYQYDDRTSLHAAIDNLMNTSYETATGFRGMPRRLRAGIKLSF